MSIKIKVKWHCELKTSLRRPPPIDCGNKTCIFTQNVFFKVKYKLTFKKPQPENYSFPSYIGGV